MSFQLINSIIKKEWAIEPGYVAEILPFIIGQLSNNPVPWQREEATRPYAVTAARQSTALADAPPGSIAVIGISGPLQKADQFCGPVGMATIGQTIQQADANPNIDGIILQIDSPGGTVDGTESLGQIISGTKKPIVAFVDGLAASAAYWLASSTDEIIASGKTTQVGSIGTAMRFADLQPRLEKEGVKFHEIYATLSSDKNKDFREARGGNYTTLINETLDPMNDVFLNTVKKNRTGKLDLKKENVLTGKVYLASAAKENGLIDDIGSMDAAVQSVRNRVDTKKKTRMSNAMKFAAICAALGFTDGFEATAEGVHLQESHLEALEAIVAGAAADRQRADDLQAQVEGMGASSEDLNAQITSLTAERDAMRDKAAAYDRSASGSGSSTVTEKDGKQAAGQASKYIDDGSEALLSRYKK